MPDRSMQVIFSATRELICSLFFQSLKAILALTTVLALDAIAEAETIDLRKVEVPFRIYSNFPACTTKRFETPVMSNSGVLLHEFGPNRYCTIVDLDVNNRNDGSDAFFALFSGTRPIQSIEIYAFSAVERRLATLLCRLSSSGVPVKMVLAEFQPNHDKLKGLARTLFDCLPTGGGKLEQYPLGGGIASFHPKYYRVNYVDGTTVLVVGSGHPQRGLSITFDHWVFYDLGTSDPLLDHHNCFARTIDEMLQRRLGPFDGMNTLVECRKRGSKSQVDPAFFFLPFDYEDLRNSLAAKIRASTEIDIAMSSVGSEWMLSQLQNAIRHGVKVRVIVDDDAYLVANEQCESCQASPSEYDAWLSVLAKSGANVRFITTNTINNTCNRYSRMHHKIAIFRQVGGDSVVLFGSANFTDAALGRPEGNRAPVNIENAYMSSAPATVAHFNKTFLSLWDLGVSQELLPKDFSSIRLIGPGC